MGVTDLRPYFTQIIGHNSVNVHRIPTKLGTELCHNKAFKCAKFQPDWSTNLCFMVDLRNVRKEVEEKNEEKNLKFGRLYLGNSSSN